LASRWRGGLAKPAKKMNVFLTALGCKLNQAEIEAMARRIEATGHQVVLTPRRAQWAIVNTCTVTHVAGRKSRQLIRRLRKECPDLRIAVTGCHAEMSPEQVRAIRGVQLVLSNSDKEDIFERILALSPEMDVPVARSASPRPRRSPLGRTRALVRIQDGCDNRCAYCIVTIARGPQRSRAPEHVLSEISNLLQEGYQEIVLTGVHIGAYGHDSPTKGRLPPSEGWSLARLVRTILDGTDVHRLRLSSVEPWDLPEVLSLWPHPRLCRHIHLPLQSGCDDTLHRMGRRYDTRQYEDLVGEIRRRVPEASITTDVIVGFPGESDAASAGSRAFIERMRFARLHVFRYSRRAGTLAAQMPNQVHPRVAKARSEHLINLGRRMSLAFHRRFVNTEVEVLFESARDEKGIRVWNGLTDNYLRVSVPSKDELTNVLATVRCISASEKGLRGKLV